MPGSHWLGSAGKQLSGEPAAQQSEGQVGTHLRARSPLAGSARVRMLSAPRCPWTLCSISSASATQPPALRQASSVPPLVSAPAGIQVELPSTPGRLSHSTFLQPWTGGACSPWAAGAVVTVPGLNKLQVLPATPAALSPDCR